MSDNKDRFLSILRTNVHREGLEELIKWLESTDFFTAPASTKFHSAYKEGLLVHSLNVYDILKARNDRDGNTESEESVALVALLHDVCKAGFYKECDIDTRGRPRGAKRLVFTQDGLRIYYTGDHYKTFKEVK